MTSAIATPAGTVIRAATADDLDAIVTMAQAFLRETPYGTQIGTNPDRLRVFAWDLLQKDDAAIAVAESDGAVVGMIALWCFLHPFSGERIAAELVWWVNPETRGSAGVRLLKWAEAWAKDQGAVALQMIAPTDRVANFYERCGFVKIEVAYQRSL